MAPRNGLQTACSQTVCRPLPFLQLHLTPSLDFVTACRTKKGFSVILVPKGEGLEVSPIKTSYSSTAGTAFVEYNNVKVPVDHLMGEEDKGFVVIMSNFNHERFGMCCGTIRKQRTIVEECLKWSNQRIVFGKRLIDQPVIRQKYVSLIPQSC